jgi:hypothetical protein
VLRRCRSPEGPWVLGASLRKQVYATYPQFVGSRINCYFVCDVEHLMNNRPKLWVHGHTHSSCDYVLGAARVVSNPFGYPREVNHEYVEKLVIEVEPEAGATG